MGNFSGSADGADPVDPAIPYALNMETLCLFCSAKRRADLLDGLRLALEELAAVSRERERESITAAQKKAAIALCQNKAAIAQSLPPLPPPPPPSMSARLFFLRCTEIDTLAWVCLLVQRQ